MFKAFMYTWSKNPKVQITILICFLLDFYRTQDWLSSLIVILVVCLNYLGLCFLLMARIPIRQIVNPKRVSEQYRPANNRLRSKQNN